MPISHPLLKINSTLSRRLDLLSDTQNKEIINAGQRGIEKESLRIDANGSLAMSPHPAQLGSALTHSILTTDYAEPLLEIITPPVSTINSVFDHLNTTHKFVMRQLDNESLWPFSMPCPLPADHLIPVANYGCSNLGRLKSIYRHGLGARYGRTMQSIAGIHYNFSLSENIWPILQESDNAKNKLICYQSDSYMALIRNYRRFSWLLLYLFGASPAFDKSFLHGQSTSLEKLDSETFYLPHATSIRMSDMGYHNKLDPNAKKIEFNSFAQYLQSFYQILQETSTNFASLGIKKGEEWIQLNTHRLQLENELYATIRPKQTALTSERALYALGKRGIQYVEARCIDLDPFESIGISTTTAYFLDAFLLYCALEESPFEDKNKEQEVDNNFGRVAREGRKPDFKLTHDGEPILLKEWSNQLLDQIEMMAELLDTSHQNTYYSKAVAEQRAKINDINLTPSAIFLNTLKETHQTFAEFGFEQSKKHKAALLEQNLDGSSLTQLNRLAVESIAKQHAIEAADNQSLENYIAHFTSLNDLLPLSLTQQHT